MAQTKAGAAKARDKMIEKHGSLEAYRKFYADIGRKGGKNGTGHKFGHGEVDPREVGRKGGLAPRNKAPTPTPYNKGEL